MAFTLRKVSNTECIAARAISVLIFSTTRLPDAQEVFDRVIRPHHTSPLPESLCVDGPLSPCGMLGMDHYRNVWVDRGFSAELGWLWSCLPHLQPAIKQILTFLRLPIPEHDGDFSVPQVPFSLSVHRGRVDFRQLATDLYSLMRIQEEIPWWMLFCSFLALELSSYFPQGMEARVEELKAKGVAIRFADVAKRDSRYPYFASRDRVVYPDESRTSLCEALRRLALEDKQAIRALLRRCWNGDMPVVPPPLQIGEPTHIRALSRLRSDHSPSSFPEKCKAVCTAIRGNTSALVAGFVIRDIQIFMADFGGRINQGPEPPEALTAFLEKTRADYLDITMSHALPRLCKRLVDFLDLIYATWTHIEPVLRPDILEDLRSCVREIEKLGLGADLA